MTTYIMDGLLSPCCLLVVILLLSLNSGLGIKIQDNGQMFEDRYSKDINIKKRQANMKDNGECPSLAQVVLPNILNKKLIGHEIFNDSMDDVMPCVKMCLYLLACKSFGFYRPNKQCILYDVDSTSVNEQEFEDLKGFIFSDIEVFPTSLAGGCQSQPCHDYQICKPEWLHYSCKTIYCDKLPTVSHSSNNGTNNGTNTLFPSVVEYTCDTGYVLHGPAASRCMANNIWSTLPECRKAYLGTTNCLENTNMVNGDKRTCAHVFGTGSACLQGVCECSKAGYVPNLTDTACVQAYLGTTNCVENTNIVNVDMRTCGQVFGTGSRCLQGTCKCSEAGYVPNLTNTACVKGYLGSTNCIINTNVVNFDTRTCEQVFGTGTTCLKGKCVCSAAGYFPNWMNRACVQGYPVTTNCTVNTNVIIYDTRTCEQAFGTGTTCVQGKCECSAAGYVPNLSKTACVQGYLGTTNCTVNTNVVNYDNRTCEQAFGTGAICVQGKCVCSAAGYVPNLINTACVQGYVGTTTCVTSSNIITRDSRTCQQVFGDNITCLGNKCECPVGNQSGCYSIFKGPTGEITSPNYPGNYNNNVTCVYLVTVTPGKRVLIQIIDFGTEHCYDMLLMYNACNSATLELAKLCGSMPAQTVYTSTSNMMMLKFKSDDSTAFKGFKLQYSEV